MRWFVLRAEGKKIANISNLIGDDLVWQPLERFMTKPARKRKPVLSSRPLIPGWLFVQESAYRLHDWPEVQGVHGVLKYGRLGTIFVDDEDLNGLRSACDYVPESPQAEPSTLVDDIPVGTSVKLRGILYGRLGVLQGYTEDGYAIVDVGIMNLKVSKKLVARA